MSTKKKRLTPLEALIMDSVWDSSEATVKQVQEDLQNTKPMAYNTVLTVMRILREKGFLSSTREGRQDVYRPLVTREEIGKRSLSSILDQFYSGSATALVSHLLESETLDEDEIKEIRRQVNAKLREQSDREGTSS